MIMVELTANEKENYLNELIELLKIPSISADSAFAKDVEAAAAWVASALEKAGAEKVEIVQTPRLPCSVW